MKTRQSVLVTLILTALCMAGCSPKKAAVAAYFDAALQSKPPYSLPGVSNYEIRSYEIVQHVGEIVSVRITYGSKLGVDLVKTKKFLVGAGDHISATDRDDIAKAIQHNLVMLSSTLGSAFLEKLTEANPPLTWDEVTKSESNKPARYDHLLNTVNGEDYSKTTFKKFGKGLYDVELSVQDKDGNAVTYRVE